MEQFDGVRIAVISIVGVLGGGLSAFLGVNMTVVSTLFLFMAIDFITGGIVAGVFKNSPKSENGGLNSKVGWKGLAKKGCTLMIVFVAAQLDKLLNINYVTAATCMAYIVIELVSIIENAGLMGVPIPNIIIQCIDLLKNTEKGEKTTKTRSKR